MRVTGDLEANGLLQIKWNKKGEIDSLPASRIWCGVFKDRDTGVVYKFRPDQLVEMCAFLDRVDTLIIHNGIDYDIPLLKSILDYNFKGQVVDTFILSQLLSPDRPTGHGLAGWGKLLGRGKPEHEDWSKFSEEMLHRCSEDVEINDMVYDYLIREIAEFEWSPIFKMEHAFGKLLVEQKKTGFLVDQPRMHKHIATLERYLRNIDKATLPMLPLRTVAKVKKKAGEFPYVKKIFLQNGGGYTQAVSDWVKEAYDDEDPDICGVFTRVNYEPFDLGSAAQIKEYLLDQGWVPEQWNKSKKTGLRTSPVLSSDDEFVGVNGRVGKIVAKRMKYRHRLSMLRGLLKIIRPDGRITSDVSGICPTVRLKHKGIVNIPGGDALFGLKMREIFIVKDGYSLVGCDAASCQLRMLCHYMGDDAYTAAVVSGKNEDGTDIHSVNMRIAGCNTRAEAKTLIYAILFGAGDPKLAAQLGCSTKQARAMRKRFMDGLPKLKQLLAQLKKVWRQRGYLIGLDGRKIFVRSEHMLLVYLLQSAEAIMMKVATLYSHKYTAQYDANMVAHVHDETQWEVKDEESLIVGELLEKAIVRAGKFLNLSVPMAGEAKVGKSWRDTH